MTTAYIVSGRVTESGDLLLDEPVPVAPGRVRVSVESLARPQTSPNGAFVWPSEEELRQRHAGLLELVGTLPDDEAERMIRMRHDEFDQVDPDEWR